MNLLLTETLHPASFTSRFSDTMTQNLNNPTSCVMENIECWLNANTLLHASICFLKKSLSASLSGTFFVLSLMMGAFGAFAFKQVALHSFATL